jgi:ATP-dependent protease ClpP protease subunit
MGNWSEILEEISGNPDIDHYRKERLKQVSKVTGRNVIAYYSGFLYHGDDERVAIRHADQVAFMNSAYGLDKNKGLDLILHTPGGDVAATESIVNYLYSIFGNNIRVIVPHMAMSGGTMIALSAKEIIMGNHSDLGPIDPQIGGMACAAVLDEFQQAIDQTTQNPDSVHVWAVILSKYYPTFLGQCKHAGEWSKELAREWLKRNMLASLSDAEIEVVVTAFTNHSTLKSHSRPISKQRCISLGLKIVELESDKDLQDAVLSAHHAYTITFTMSKAVKIVENSLGVSYVEIGS